MLYKIKRLYLNLEKYLAFHVDFLIGLNNIAIGWSVLLGPEKTLRNTYFLSLDSRFLGVSLLTSGTILILISLSNAVWKEGYLIFLIPPIFYIYQILGEMTLSNFGTITPAGYLFLVTTLFIVTFLLIRRTGIRSLGDNDPE